MKLALGFAIALALGAPLAADAADAYVVADISLNSGPDSDYPPIDNLSAGTAVDVNGCIEGFSWCDVSAGEDRGWVPGSFLEQEYDNQPVYLVDYGPRIGIPVVSFNIGVYWDQHYHNRPFYSQRTQWANRHIAVRPPPRPSIAHAPPIPHGGDHHGAPNAHAQPAHANAAPAPRPAAAPQAEHRAPERDNRQPAPHDEMANRATRERTATPPKPQVAPPKPEERASTPQRTVERAQPKPEQRAPAPKPAERSAPKPKEEPKKEEKQPEHKDDDHGL
jgi:uncharacterized protein YraI